MSTVIHHSANILITSQTGYTVHPPHHKDSTTEPY
uniref:Uncharacterized protein n=1 Tax=Anguilla anguilla TaxID=7936 RepID=A0A0E9UW43_ANGAN